MPFLDDSVTQFYSTFQRNVEEESLVGYPPLVVRLRRIKDTVWRGSSPDPQELAEAEAAFRGTKADPDAFNKTATGEFYFEAPILHLDPTIFPWDELIVDKFQPRRP